MEASETHQEIERLSIAGKEIILVGTAHVSAKSAALVKETIAAEKPDVVGVELCKQRYIQLLQGEAWRETNIIDVIKRGQTYLFLVNLLLANLQRRFGQGLGVKPGQEMIDAAKSAEAIGVKVELLDRDVRVTLKRAMRLMGVREKFKLLYAIIVGFFGEEQKLSAEDVEQLKRTDVMTELMEHLSRELPAVKRVLVDERDSYIASKILACTGKKIVAVVGAGHLKGIKEMLLQTQQRGSETAEKIRALEKLPPKGKAFALLKFLVPAAFALVLAYAFITKGFETSIGILAYWVLINGSLAALGAALAGAHPLSIATAFLAAPITTLHPLLAVGWFAGLMEARLRMPKVKDFEELRNLNSYRDFIKNPVTRILLVTAFANIGGTIGTVIALPYIIALLA